MSEQTCLTCNYNFVGGAVSCKCGRNNATTHTPKPDTERPKIEPIFVVGGPPIQAFNCPNCVSKTAYDALEAELRVLKETWNTKLLEYRQLKEENAQLLKEQKQIVFSRRDAIANLKSAKEKIVSLTRERDEWKGEALRLKDLTESYNETLHKLKNRGIL